MSPVTCAETGVGSAGAVAPAAANPVRGEVMPDLAFLALTVAGFVILTLVVKAVEKL